MSRAAVEGAELSSAPSHKNSVKPCAGQRLASSPA